jgi:signal transduction histidine kinase
MTFQLPALPGSDVELRERVAELERENEALRAFVAQAAHELIQPLIVAETYALLASEDLSATQEDAREALERLRRTSVRARLLVDSLLLDADRERNGLALAPVDLREALGNALDLLGPEVESRKALLVVEELPTIVGDDAGLVAVFRNLLSNALRHGREGGTIKVSAELHAPDWWVFVDSDGEELSREERARIFARFTRGATRAAGYGLGLSICRCIVERHGGRIGAGLAPQGGNRFFFTLPAT